ncbi:uncharacterized protein [Ptychodera flava]|uniref:uncharacterized protein n=1 Tax=Ptychodera flava TaxID=63121 RepID=UPI003969CE9E
MALFQVQVKFHGKIRNIYTERPSYSQLVYLVKENVVVLRDADFQMQYTNEANEKITLGNSDMDMQDLFRCSDPVPHAEYRRVRLEILENSPACIKQRRPRGNDTDSPCLVTPRKSHRSSTEGDRTFNDDNQNYAPLPESRRQLSYESVFERQDRTDWKTAKVGDLTKEIALLKDEKMAMQQQRKEMERPVALASPIGTNRRSTCAVCHRAGHRATGNKNNESCLVGTPCKGYLYCGRKDRHKQDHLKFAKVARLKEEESKKTREIREKESQLKQLEDFQSKTISAFSIAIGSRLTRAFPEVYNPKTQSGKVELQRDLTILREAYGNNVNKIPVHVDVASDRAEFSKILNEKKKKLYGSGNTSQQDKCSAASAEYIRSLMSVSPIKVERKPRVRSGRWVHTVDETSTSTETESEYESHYRPRKKMKHKKKPRKQLYHSDENSSPERRKGDARGQHHRQHWELDGRFKLPIVPQVHQFWIPFNPTRDLYGNFTFPDRHEVPYGLPRSFPTPHYPMTQTGPMLQNAAVVDNSLNYGAYDVNAGLGYSPNLTTIPQGRLPPVTVASVPVQNSGEVYTSNSNPQNVQMSTSTDTNINVSELHQREKNEDIARNNLEKLLEAANKLAS